MSFSKNPPWLTVTSTAPTPSLQAQMGLPNPMSQPVFSQGLTISTPQAPPPPSISLITQMGAAPVPHNQLYTQTVSYPAPRPLNTIAYPQTHQLQQVQTQQISPVQPQMMATMAGVGQMNTISPVACPTNMVQSNIMATQRAYTGTVTKIQGDVGFIDDEIFFHKSVVNGVPKVGEHVFVEASYAQDTPFKWNASRVQLLTPTGNTALKSNYNTHPSTENGGYNNNRSNSGRSIHQSSSSVSSHRSHSPHRRSLDLVSSKRDMGRDLSDHDRHRRRSDRPEEREKRERRDYTPPERRDRSPASRSSASNRQPVSTPPPTKKRRRIVPRYMVQIPKVALKLLRADVLELKQRYNNLYIPSDFFHTEVRWSESFTPDNPYVLRQPCSFHIMNKEIPRPTEIKTNGESLLDPPDADSTFSAKVMLMSVPPMSVFFKECFTNAADEDEEEDRNLVHPSRMISFLVGLRGKNETMAIGGAWSPSLDGKNPESDPTVLIRTAIRTCKALTGIDLSRCTQWYRFVELYYHRRETGRVQTVVVYLPDIRSCVPTVEEWQLLQKQYKLALQCLLDQNHNSSKASNSNPEISKKGDKKEESKIAEMKESAAESSTSTAGEKKSTETAAAGTEKGAGVEMEAEPEETTVTQDEDAETEKKGEGAPMMEAETTAIVPEADSPANPPPTVADNDEEKDEIESEDVEMKEEEDKQVYPKSMKIPELKEALTARNLPTKGLKADLVERLTEALKKELEDKQESVKEDIKTVSPVAPKEESNQSMEEGEPDLANMTVIDECCDPSKQKMDEVDKEKAVATKNDMGQKVVKKFDEKEIRQLERRYTIPENPEIIVHPSKTTAKGGKFDCASMSLSVLLDYVQDDSKEHSFEVYLFAELFNEMLMRDAGYNIYKALYGMPERKEEEEQRDRKKSESKEAKSGKSVDDKEVTVVTTEQDADNSNKKKEKARKKQVTFNPDLLLSFAYFDQTHCGYILCKDVEDILCTIGLSLSKNQIRKVVKKVAASDSLYYRKLTDKDKEEVEKEDSTKPETGNCALIAKGNSNLLPVFKSSSAGGNGHKQSGSQSAGQEEDGNDKETGLIMYNGALLNVEKLMERIKTAERSLLDNEQELTHLKKENTELTATNSSSKAKIKDLSRKLNDSETLACSFRRKNSEYSSVISSIQEKIAPLLPVKKDNRSTEKDEKKVLVKQDTKSKSATAAASPRSVTPPIKKEK